IIMSGNNRIVDLLQLQNLTKRDPAAYKEEFMMQYQHYLTQLQIFQLKPTKDYKHFSQLVSYLSHVCPLYPKEMAEFPKQIADLLENNCNNLEPDLRRILSKSLILMRNRNMMQQIPLLSLFFKLFRVQDKPLRKLIYSYIITDIKNTNLKTKNVKLNKTLQNFMFTMMNDSSEVATLMSLKVMVELFRKKIWHDTKTVNVICNGVFSKNTKIVATTLNFFLHIDNPDKKDDSDVEESKQQDAAKRNMKAAALAHKVAKKTKSRVKRAEKAKTDYKKLMEANEKKSDPNFPAIELIHDPQTYAERLFSVLRRTTDKFETRMLMMNFISRLIHTHKLLIFNFYPYIQKYIQPHQKNVTYIMAVLAQSCHELVDPDIIKPVIRAIATYFVNDGCNPEVIAIGLNTIRNVCQRCPLAMDTVLLNDLIQYRHKKEKGVMMAGRSLLQFFRDYHPSMLKKKDRGNRSVEKVPLQFGQTVVSKGVEGIELLYDEELNKKLEQYENGELDLDEDDSDDEEGWEDVSGEEDEEEDGEEWVTDDEDEEDGDEGEWEDVDQEDDVDKDEWEEVDEDEEDSDESEEEEDEADDESEEDEQHETGFNENEVEGLEEKVKEKKIKKEEEMDIRILTDEDIEKIQKLKMLKEALESKDKKRKRSPLEGEEEDSDEEPNPLGFITAGDLVGSHKKKKHNYDERMAMVKEGREGREEYKSKKARKEKYGKSIRNELKAKLTKPFMLMKQAQSVRGKQFLSLHDKQINKQTHIQGGARNY
ncbi:hypothetical protein SAMD00019534_096680, partial [Acytostelium subglobosum LB1]|uniref:hypothetical protein n=1 Tax=Acytostelium subglobosum LB1 TaxID=1410327 RepID=UPI000644E02A